MKFNFSRLFAFSAPLALCLSGCISLEKLPKVSLPKVNVPFVGGTEGAPANDPAIPYSINQTLGFGHTLELSVYAGTYSPQRIYGGKVMVDEQGNINLGDFGMAKVGGLKATEALKQIQTAFIKKRGEAIINVHLSRIEEMPVITVTGAVKHPGVIQWYDDANAASLLPYAGGRSGEAKGEAVYVFHLGTRRFYATLTGASLGTLHAGDIVHFSEDL